MKIETEEYMTIERREEVKAEARKLRRQFLRYKEAEIAWSTTAMCRRCEAFTRELARICMGIM